MRTSGGVTGCFRCTEWSHPTPTPENRAIGDGRQTSVSFTRRLPITAVISIAPPSASTYRRTVEMR
jgi:hypothetical protein